MNNQPESPLPTVLYIEADTSILTWTTPILQRRGCRVIEAHDIATAHSAIKENPHLDLVILGDVSRPVSNGNVPAAEMSLLLKFRSNDAFQSMPIIIATTANWFAEASQAGATAYLRKPFGAGALEAAVLPLLPQPSPALLNYENSEH